MLGRFLPSKKGEEFGANPGRPSYLQLSSETPSHPVPTQQLLGRNLPSKKGEEFVATAGQPSDLYLL